MEGVWRRMMGHGWNCNSECILWVIYGIVHVMGGEGESLVCHDGLVHDK